jgi:hypothetical protein
MKPLRPWNEVVTDWVQELSERLGRPCDRILAQGLSAHDFSPCHSVEIRQPSGMTIRFGYAFAVIRPALKQAVVFTEHDGYVEFDLSEDTVVAEISERIYRQE